MTFEDHTEPRGEGQAPLKESEATIRSAEASSQESDNVPARKAGKLDVLIQGVALFSDGYNIQIIGYMNSILAKL
jgi:hypothetical protein